MELVRILEQDAERRKYKLEIVSDNGRGLEHLERLRKQLPGLFVGAYIERADEKRVVCWVWRHEISPVGLDDRDYLAAELLKVHQAQRDALAVEYGSTMEDFFLEVDEDEIDF